MANDIKNFFDFKSHEISVQVGNREFIDTTGVGTVTKTALVKDRRETCVFRYLLYSPGLTYNALPVSKICSKDFRVLFDKEENDSRGSCK